MSEKEHQTFEDKNSTYVIKEILLLSMIVKSEKKYFTIFIRESIRRYNFTVNLTFC